jgi:hypothetical protein
VAKSNDNQKIRPTLFDPTGKFGRPVEAGWITSAPSFKAANFTAAGVSLRPRPLGRSGWLTTILTSWPFSCSATREGTENSGVPMNITLNLFFTVTIYLFEIHDTDFQRSPRIGRLS